MQNLSWHHTRFWLKCVLTNVGLRVSCLGGLVVPHSRAKQEDSGSTPALGKSGKIFLKTLRAGIERLNLETWSTLRGG